MTAGIRADRRIVPVAAELLSIAGYIHALAWQASHRDFCAPEFIALHTVERQTEYLRAKWVAGTDIYMLIDCAPVGIVSVTGDLIEDLYVLPDRQNRGYGTALLRHAAARCAGPARLWILENNSGARRLYEREGFVPTGRRSAITDKLDEIEFILSEKPSSEVHSIEHG